LKNILKYNPRYYQELYRLYSRAHNIKNNSYNNKIPLEKYVPNIEKLKIKLLKINDKHRGYIFFNNIFPTVYKESINVDDIFIEKNYNTPANYRILLESINSGLLSKRYRYAQLLLDDSKKLSNVISTLDLTLEKKMIEMKIDITANKKINKPDNVDFIIYKKGIDEAKRVAIQNSIFKDTRGHVDCDIDDIIYEQQQDYFVEDGCIFLCYDGEIAGYSQIILERGSTIKPFIVNFGIHKNYRNRGLSIPLLYHTLNIIKLKGFKEAYLTVDASNKKAYRLYKKTGFKDVGIYCYYLYRY